MPDKSANAKIPFRARVSARSFQLVYRMIVRLQLSSPELQFATKPIATPTTMKVPTRHGLVRCLVYRPVDADIAAMASDGHLPAAHVRIHPGAFIARQPAQEDNVARYLASETSCFVIVPDYDTAPSVTFPVSEEQTYDVFQWVHEHGSEHGWDGDRVSVGGASAGGKHALSVVQQSIEAGSYVPVAVTAEYAVGDIAKPDSERTSPKPNPVINAGTMALVRRTYFAGVPDVAIPLASPARYTRLGEFPPTLIMTGGLDTLRFEMNEMAEDLRIAGVDVTHREFAGVDHGFTHYKPVKEVAREAITMIGDHLRSAHAPGSSREG